jgi:hypothetical protein
MGAQLLAAFAVPSPSALPSLKKGGGKRVARAFFSLHGEGAAAAVCKLTTNAGTQHRHDLLLVSLFFTGRRSATPLWHMMIGVSTVMYTTSYLARDCKS